MSSALRALYTSFGAALFAGAAHASGPVRIVDACTARAHPWRAQIADIFVASSPGCDFSLADRCGKLQPITREVYMKRACLAGIACLGFIAGTASAQVTVIGGGLAKDCFLKVESGSTNYVDVKQTCTLALESEVMTRINRAATYVNRGIIRMRSGDHDGALGDFDRAISLQEDLGAAYLNRGAALILLGDYENAKFALDTAIDLDTKDMHAAHYNRAIAKERTGDIPGAYYDFQEAAGLKPDWDLPLRQLERFTVSNG